MTKLKFHPRNPRRRRSFSLFKTTATAVYNGSKELKKEKVLVITHSAGDEGDADPPSPEALAGR